MMNIIKSIITILIFQIILWSSPGLAYAQKPVHRSTLAPTLQLHATQLPQQNVKQSSLFESFFRTKKTPYTQINKLLEQIKEMPAYELVKTFELENATLLKEKEYAVFGITTHTIRVPRRKQPNKPPRGIDILHNELAPTREFDLLYNQQGHLISIVPIVTDALQSRSKRWKLPLRYFDLTTYYIDIPQPGDPDALQKWQERAKQNTIDRAAIEKYLIDKNIVHTVLPVDKREQKAFVSVVLRKIPHIPVAIPDFVQFEPEDIAFLGDKAITTQAFRNVLVKDAAPGIVFPVLPTVYSPATHDHIRDDFHYHSKIYTKATAMKLKRGEQSLVIGPGTGIDVWILWHATGQPIYTIGINPLEIANTRIFAKIANIPVTAIVGDNIMSSSGVLRFGRKMFELIISNFPIYRPLVEIHPIKAWFYKTVQQIRIRFDQAQPMPLFYFTDGASLKEIRTFARGIFKTLQPHRGLAIVWNRTSFDDEMKKIMKKEGLKIIQSNLETEGNIEAMYTIRIAPRHPQTVTPVQLPLSVCEKSI